MQVNVDNIINTPEKILRRGYDELKSNYTKTGAIQYYDVYSKMPLSVILSNAKLIYAEPYKGYDFISNLVQNNIIPIMWYDKLKEMVDKTIEEYTDKIGVDQMNSLKALSQRIHMKAMQFTGIRNLMKFVSNDIDAADDKIMVVYDKIYVDGKNGLDAAEELTNRLDTLPDYMRIMLSAHLAGKAVTNILTMKETELAENRLQDMCNKAHIANVVSRILKADYFRKHVDALPMLQRHIIELAGAHDSEVITNKELSVKESVNDVYSDPVVLITSMYENAILDPQTSSVYEESKNENLMIEKAVLDIDTAYLVNDYLNNPDGVYEESFLDDSISAQIMLKEITALTERSDKIDSLITYERKTPDTWRPDLIDDSPAPTAPKESLSRRIQNAGLDADIRYKKAAASARQKTQGVRNAAKAVTKVPKNVIDSIEDKIEEFDNADDMRRKKYIAEPGFRKKYWRLLKLACAHLLAFKISPIINIILFIATKLGGEKNKRIRNELMVELRTEMKVIDQKIEYAKTKEDEKAVYKLIRMKDKLEQELARVATNSKRV